MRVGQSAKHRGAYPTPPWLVADVVRHTMPAVEPGSRVTVLDPACGDGRFLVAAADVLLAAGAIPVLRGIDVDPAVVAHARRQLASLDGAVELAVADALAGDQPLLAPGSADVVVGNPPYLSQLATATTRGGRSDHGGGPYADAAAEFLALAVRAARPDGGRVGLVLPQSLLASRDAAPIRAEVDALAAITWSWWSSRPVFEANVLVCALTFERRADRGQRRPWSAVVTDALGVPTMPDVRAAGRLADRVRLTANFRDQYYALASAVGEDGDGPQLVTSGLIEPGRCLWGERPVTFARRRHARPRVELSRLPPRMRRWAADLLVPKVLIANQTTVLEAVVDRDGGWLPSVPVISARLIAPSTSDDALWEVAAVLTSPMASAWAWHRAAGTGLSAHSLRLGPRWLGELPWPAGPLAPAVAALRSGDLAATGCAVNRAYGALPTLAGGAGLVDWWVDRLPPRRG